MTHGLRILNQDDRVQIDENDSHLYPTSDTTAYSSTLSFPLPGQAASDLVAARAPVGSSKVILKPTLGYSGDNDGIYYHLLRKLAGNVTPPTSSYGFNVKGPSSEALFLATYRETMFDVAAVGIVPADVTLATEVYFPSSTTTVPNLDKYYCVLNNTYSVEFANDPIFFSHYYGFKYIWTSGTTGRIAVRSRGMSGSSNPPDTPGETVLANNSPYMILKRLP